jgi:hypothetical protein
MALMILTLFGPLSVAALIIVLFGIRAVARNCRLQDRE